MEFSGKNPFMDYRNSVPFMDLSGFVMSQKSEAEDYPAKSLQEYLFKKKCTTMINLRRLRYRSMCEAYQRMNRKED